MKNLKKMYISFDLDKPFNIVLIGISDKDKSFLFSALEICNFYDLII